MKNWKATGCCGKATKFGVICLVFWSVSVVHSIPVEEDLTFSEQERTALVEFRTRVGADLPYEYMREDMYLIKWLRAKNLNQRRAERMLRENLRWRKANQMDMIHLEDWSDMEELFPFSRDTFDKEGRPIAAISFGTWNIRQVIVQGKVLRFRRYLNKLLDQITMDVMKERQAGRNVTQWKVIYNMEDFSLVRQGCAMCLPIIIGFQSSYESHFPGMVDQVIIVNTPPTFHLVLNLLRPVFSRDTRQALRVFGGNKSKWMEYLDSEISRDQRTPEFGGTKTGALKGVWVQAPHRRIKGIST